MAVVYKKKDQGITYSVGTGVPSHSGTTADQYIDTDTGVYYVYRSSTWNNISTGGGGGLTYFSETGNTISPNGTVPVVGLIANSGATNIDIAIVPKGTGAILAAIPNNAGSGGNKRGTNAVDLQTSRSTATQVASGQAAVIAGGDQNTASGPLATVGGGTNNISSNYRTTVSGGIYNTASNVHATVGGGYNNTSSGEASFTVGEANIASGSRSVALGQSNTAGGTNATAIGYLNTSNGFASASIGYGNSTAYDYNCAIGFSNSLTSGPVGNNSYVFAFGIGNTVNAGFATAIGCYGLTNGVTGRQTFSSGRIATNGDAQKSTFFYRGRTTDATLTNLATDGGGGLSVGNSMQLANNSSIRFKGSIIAKQSGSTNTSAWDVDGLIVRGSSAASTSLVVGNVNLVSNLPNWGSPVLSAYIDSFNGIGALRIQIQGAVGTNIQWTAVIETTEVIYA